MCGDSSCVPWQQVEVDATGIKLKIKKDFKELSGEHIDWLKPLKVHYQLKCADTIGQLVKAAELQRFLLPDSYAKDLHLNLEH